MYMYSTTGYTFGTVYQKFLFTGINKKKKVVYSFTSI